MCCLYIRKSDKQYKPHDYDSNLVEVLSLMMLIRFHMLHSENVLLFYFYYDTIIYISSKTLQIVRIGKVNHKSTIKVAVLSILNSIKDLFENDFQAVFLTSFSINSLLKFTMQFTCDANKPLPLSV